MQLEQDIPASALVRVSLLGPLEVYKRDQSGTWKLVPEDKWKNSRPARSVLKRLLVQPGRRLSREQLADDVWSESDSEPTGTTVYSAISLIRGVIGKPLVKLYVSAYEIAGQTLVWTDLDACSALLKEAENRGQGSIQAAPFLEQAVALLERGELLEGEYGKWCYAFRKRAEDLFRQARMWLAESYEAQGKLWQAGEQYRAMILTNPSDEDALQHWITMLHRQGKIQEALKCYRDMKEFVEEQGFTLSLEIEQVIASLGRSSSSALNSPFVQGIFLPTQGTMISKGLGDPMDQLRRKFLQGAAGMLLPLFFGAGSKNALALDEIVSHGGNIITACWHLMKGKEINAAEELLDAYTPTLLHLAFQISPYQQAIAMMATQACMIRAIIAKHHLNPIAREMYCHEAIQCSRLSSDKSLRAGALMYLGYTYTFCNPFRPQKAIDTFLEALGELEDSDDLVRSDICIGLADAYALVNNESQAKRTIQMAQDCFPSRPEQSASFLYADCALDTLYQWEAKMYLDLAQHDQRQDYYKNARNVLEQSTRIHALSERCMVETVIYQTNAALGLRDLDAYASCLEVGASTALQMGSQRRYQEALDLYQQVPKAWKQEPKMQHLAAFFQESNEQEKHA